MPLKTSLVDKKVSSFALNDKIHYSINDSRKASYSVETPDGLIFSRKFLQGILWIEYLSEVIYPRVYRSYVI